MSPHARLNTGSAPTQDRQAHSRRWYVELARFAWQAGLVHFLKGDYVAGIPVEHARAVVQAMEMLTLRSTAVATRAGIDVAQAEGWLSSLETAGFVHSDRAGGTSVWAVSDSGAALAKATLRRPIKRATAEQLLERVVARAFEYNRNPRFLYSVERLRVFGSFLDDARDRLGDLDIELTLGPRPPAEEAKAYTRRYAPHLTSTTDLLFWPKHEVRHFLAGGSRSIDFQDAGDGALETPMRVVYERSADAGALVR